MQRKILNENQLEHYKQFWKTQTMKEWCELFGLSRTSLEKTNKELGIKFGSKKRVVSDTTKEKIREKRKIWLKENPDKHPWKNHDKFKSIPCEEIKKFLDKKGIIYIAEFDPKISNRHFCIDIAFPDKLIALEINGNQHYERDGKLKPYYQERHELLLSAGWTVFEIHYSFCFNMEKWTNFIDILNNSKIVNKFDYFNYVPPCEKKYFCECGKPKSSTSKLCISCGRTADKIHLRRTVRPSKEELTNLLWSQPLTSIAKIYNVSDVSIKKWAKRFNISCPPKGYWLKTK